MELIIATAIILAGVGTIAAALGLATAIIGEWAWTHRRAIGEVAVCGLFAAGVVLTGLAVAGLVLSWL